MAADSTEALEAQAQSDTATSASKPPAAQQQADPGSPTHSRQDLSTGSFMLEDLALPFCSLPEAFDAGRHQSFLHPLSLAVQIAKGVNLCSSHM